MVFSGKTNKNTTISADLEYQTQFSKKANFQRLYRLIPNKIKTTGKVRRRRTQGAYNGAKQTYNART